MLLAFESLLGLLFSVSKETLKMREQDYSVAKKEDGTIVTSVDLEANKMLIDGIRSIFGAQTPIVSEENGEGENAIAMKEDHFLIDPIDGTYGLVRGSDFAINVAYIKNSLPVYGAIAIPTRGQIFYTTDCFTKVQKASSTSIETIQRKRPRQKIEKDHYKMIINNRSMLKNNILFTNADIQKIFCSWGFNFNTLLTGVASVKYCMLLEEMGDMVCSLGKLMSWDLAAPSALMRAVNFRMVDEYCKDITFDNQKPNNVVFAYQNEIFSDFIEKVF